MNATFRSCRCLAALIALSSWAGRAPAQEPPETIPAVELAASDPKQADEPPGDALVEVITERYPSGGVKIVREMKQDGEGNFVLDGSWRLFDEQGRLIIDGRFASNEKEGAWRRFYAGDDASLLATAPYRDFAAPFISVADFRAGRLHGTWTITDGEERKVHEIEFSSGERHGKATWFYPNGTVLLETQYEHGQVHGEVKRFAADSSIEAQVTYQNGRQLAPRIEFHDQANDVKKSEVSYLRAPLTIKTPDEWETARLASFEIRGQDERHGPFSTWHANGQLARQGEFRYDLPVGKVTYWSATGQKQLEGTYIEGQAHGTWTWWHENGQKAITGEYDQARPIGTWSWWTQAGQLAHKISLSDHRLPDVTTPEAISPIREARLPDGLPLR